jgi:hypothetical protein
MWRTFFWSLVEKNWLVMKIRLTRLMRDFGWDLWDRHNPPPRPVKRLDMVGICIRFIVYRDSIKHNIVRPQLLYVLAIWTYLNYDPLLITKGVEELAHKILHHETKDLVRSTRGPGMLSRWSMWGFIFAMHCLCMVLIYILHSEASQ